MELVRIEPTHKLWRWYSAYVRHDLFAPAVLVRCWGRLGSLGVRGSVEPYASWHEAEVAQQRIIAAKLRRGYRLLPARSKSEDALARQGLRDSLP